MLKTSIKHMLTSEKTRGLEIADFANKNKDLLIIIGNPHNDNLFMAYGGLQVVNRIKSADGLRRNVVKNIVRHSTFASNIDRFLVSLMDSLQLSIQKGNNFYQWVDGALYNVSKMLKLKKERKAQ